MHDPVIVGVVNFGLALLLMAAGIWVALALALAGLIGFVVHWGSADIAGNVLFTSTNDFTLTAVPLFVFLGELLLRCGASETIFRGTSRLFAAIPGGRRPSGPPARSSSQRACGN